MTGGIIGSFWHLHLIFIIFSLCLALACDAHDFHEALGDGDVEFPFDRHRLLALVGDIADLA